MATVAGPNLLGCDGFRVESPQGLLGWVEETWLGEVGEPTALAVRTLDGRRGLLLAEEVEAVPSDSELVLMREDARLLELDLPRVEPTSVDGGHALAASWHTTGEVLEPPAPPGVVDRALLALRPWRLAPPPQSGHERPLWQVLVLLYTCVAMVVMLLTGLSFLAGHLAA